MENQATPKTHPAGVQGAFSKLEYHSEAEPLFINRTPIPKAPKLEARKSKKSKILCFILFNIKAIIKC